MTSEEMTPEEQKALDDLSEAAASEIAQDKSKQEDCHAMKPKLSFTFALMAFMFSFASLHDDYAIPGLIAAAIMLVGALVAKMSGH